MKHLVGSVIRVLIDYLDYIPLCDKLKSALEVQREWPEIRQILGKNKFACKFSCEKCLYGRFLNVIFATFFSATLLSLFLKVTLTISSDLR